MMPQNQRSIGIFDSGLGGLTVMQQITRTLPQEHIVYFGDTARMPYGGKSSDTIARYSIENAIFLMEQNVKVIVIACNTASAFGIDKLRKIFNIPVIGVIEPGAERAVQVSLGGRIAVLGTKGTINSGMYEREILKRLPSASITSIACPLFVHLVEESFIHHPAAQMIVKEYIAPLKGKVDTVLLGCTHYPLLRHLIEKELDKEIVIVDSAMTCAEQVSSILQKESLHTLDTEQQQHKFFVSDDPEKFKTLGREFLGMPLEHVEAVNHMYRTSH